MIGFIDGPEAIIVLVIILVLFGGSQIPKLAKNLGKAQKEFKDGLADGEKGEGVPDAKRTTTEQTTEQ